MITKFKSSTDNFKTIEFQRVEKELLISIEEIPEGDYLEVQLNEENLFSLIGQLLRIQSEIKKIK